MRFDPRHLLAALLLSAFPSLAHANAGVPLIALVWPSMWAALVFVVLIEAKHLSSKLGMGFKPALKKSFQVNLASTALGYPLVWAALLGLEMVTTKGQAWGLDTPSQKFTAAALQAAWLIPYEEDLHWILPIALLVNLVPAYFVSWFSEAWLFSKLTGTEWKASKRVFGVANSISYGFLILALLILMLFDR